MKRPDPSRVPVEAKSDAHRLLLRDDWAGTEMRFTAPREFIYADHVDEMPRALDRMERVRTAGQWCAGHVSYETGCGLDPRNTVPARWRDVRVTSTAGPSNS